MIKITLKNSVKIRLLIAKKGESLSSFSNKIGISQGYLSQILSSKYNPSAKVAYKIAKGLGVNIEDIFFVNPIDISIGDSEVHGNECF